MVEVFQVKQTSNMFYNIITILALVSQYLISKAFETTIELDARFGLNDGLSENTGRPKGGDIPILNRKVIKGHRVTIREHPYVASVRRKFSHYVSGAILSKNVVVTVAHPIHDVPIIELGIVLGENYSDRGSALLTVVLIIVRHDFDPFTMRNDICLLRTYEEFNFRGAVKPIKLLSPTSPLHGNKAFVTGWGRCDSMGSEVCLSRGSKYFPDEKMDPMLRTVTFSVVHPNEKCLEYAQHGTALSAGMVCLGESREESPASACLAAPGAPLVVGAVLAGLQSWGYGCGYITDLPLVYTDIQHYNPWLLQNIAILHTVTQRDMRVLFEVTRAAILVEWLSQTRAVPPVPQVQSNKKLERLEIDTHLVKINGSVLDIRDYVEDGAHHTDKQDMHELFRKLLDEEKKIISIAKSHKTEAKPFLAEDAMLIGYNKTDLTSTGGNTSLIITPLNNIEEENTSMEEERL